MMFLMFFTISDKNKMSKKDVHIFFGCREKIPTNLTILIGEIYFDSNLTNNFERRLKFNGKCFSCVLLIILYLTYPNFYSRKNVCIFIIILKILYKGIF